MGKYSWKKTIFALIATVPLLIGGFLLFSWYPSIDYPIHYWNQIGTSKCYIGNWESFDEPGLAILWSEKLKQAGIKATDISASSMGESTTCITYTVLGIVGESTPASIAANTNVYATIQVKNVSDDTALGEIMTKISSAIEKSKSEFRYVDISLTFVADQNQNKTINFSPDHLQNLLKRGLTHAQLIQTLDGRYIPPTVTPLPKKK